MITTRWSSLLILVGAVVFALAGSTTTVVAQTEPAVEFQIDFPNYDVVYIADFVDIRTGKLSGTIPDFYIGARTNPPGQQVSINLIVNAFAKLRGDARPREVCTGGARTLQPFTLRGQRTFTARDLASGAKDRNPDIEFDCNENEDLKNDLEEHAKRFPTAPVGTYTVTVRAVSATSGATLGTAEKTVTIVAATVAEVQVSLIDPPPAAEVPTFFPTFSWTTESPKVTLYVYEKLPIHRSPEEAVDGIPHLKRDLEGATTFTYPTAGARRLEVGKSYYWFIEAHVNTNRGVEMRRSEIRMFTIETYSSFAQLIARLLGQLGGDAASLYDALAQDGWRPSGRIEVDGRPITREQLIALVNSLMNKEFDIRVENE